MKSRKTAVVMAVLLMGPAAAKAAGERQAKADGYLEWRDGDLLVVDGQRIRGALRLKFKGKGAAKDIASIPLGYEVKAKGARDSSGVIVAQEMEAKPNGVALWEAEVKAATDRAEAAYRKAGRFLEGGADGRVYSIGELYESGPGVTRVRRVVSSLCPAHLSLERFRCYVIDHKEWNAFAMGNFSIYVFNGLLKDVDDDELAIVIGHEMVHATHEHSRRQAKKDMWIQMATAGGVVAAEQIDDDTARLLTQVGASLGLSAWRSGYGRDLEDQADRVGLRYAYEAGYDIRRGPRLWDRFAKKYGEGNVVANFFFGDHSLSSARARNLERELALNYPAGPKRRPSRAR